jgi:integrase
MKADQSLSPIRRRDTLSALATVARAMRREMKDVPAHAGFIREQLKGFTPSMLDPPVSMARWRNVTSLTNGAMRLSGVPISTGRYQAPIAPAWQMLLAKVDGKKRFDLSKLAQFCTAEGIAPDDVDDEVLARFHAHLKQTLTNKSPRDIHRKACKVWNKAAETIEGWPQPRVKVPCYRRDYAIPRGQFLPSLLADVDGYVAHLGPDDVLADDSDFHSLRPISIKTRALELHEFASALVHRGIDPQTLTSLADLVEVETFKEGLRFFYQERTPGKYLQAYRMAVILLPVAKYWVKAPPEQIKELKTLCKRLDKQPKGMTVKNRKMLAQFDDDAVEEKFVSLPDLIMEDVDRAEAAIAKGKKPPRSRATGRSLNTPYQRALLAQTATAIEILIMAPLRRANVGGIEMGVHLLPNGGGYRLQFEEHEVKNEQRLAPPLPDESAKLVRVYIAKHREHLTDQSSTFLFPGKKGPQKNLGALTGQIVRAAKEYAGITLTAHLFRHIAAKLHLKANPGDYGTVKVLLGHRNIQTTINAYCESEQPAAYERYDEHVLGLRKRCRDGSSSSAKPKEKGS